MKKILLINGSSYYSTGNILKILSSSLEEYYHFFSITADNPNSHFRIPRFNLLRQLGKIPAQFFGNDGFAYCLQKRRIYKLLNEIKPDIVHIHNVHGYWFNLKVLLDYCELHKTKVVFTMHDCWAFTGRCAHFFDNSCYKWKIECNRCKYLKSYPKSRFFDLSKKYFNLKKHLLTNKGIVFVSPSKWVADYAKQSFLKSENIQVINNCVSNGEIGLDSSKEDFLKTFAYIDFSKKIILSVAYPFSKEKGLDDFIELDKIIDHSKYQIVLIGAIQDDLKGTKIIGTGPVFNREFIAQFYSNSYCFCFLSHQENYPTVLLESLKYGCPIISYDVGGCREICKSDVGRLAEKGDINSISKLLDEINTIDKIKCVKEGEAHSVSKFSSEYRKIYDDLLND